MSFSCTQQTQRKDQNDIFALQKRALLLCFLSRPRMSITLSCKTCQHLSCRPALRSKSSLDLLKMSLSPAPASPKKKARRPRKRTATAAHPTVEVMVREAIKSLKERKGSSLAAIKKYIMAHYKVDMVRMSPFIRRYVKKAVADKTLKQSSGTGASGRFRLGKAPKAPKKKAKRPKKKAAKRKPKKAKRGRKPKAARPKKARKPKAKKAAKPKVARKPKAKKASKKAKK